MDVRDSDEIKFWAPYAIDATRLHQTKSRVVPFLILSRFGPRRGRRGGSERNAVAAMASS